MNSKYLFLRALITFSLIIISSIASGQKIKDTSVGENLEEISHFMNKTNSCAQISESLYCLEKETWLIMEFKDRIELKTELNGIVIEPQIRIKKQPIVPAKKLRSNNTISPRKY